jgi:hypothetical protein
MESWVKTAVVSVTGVSLEYEYDIIASTKLQPRLRNVQPVQRLFVQVVDGWKDR